MSHEICFLELAFSCIRFLTTGCHRFNLHSRIPTHFQHKNRVTICDKGWKLANVCQNHKYSRKIPWVFRVNHRFSPVFWGEHVPQVFLVGVANSVSEGNFGFHWVINKIVSHTAAQIWSKDETQLFSLEVKGQKRSTEVKACKYCKQD